jgi:aminopeptidase N
VRALATVVLLGSLATPTPGAPGAGDPYFPDDGNGGIDVVHYDVHDRYDLATGQLRGHTTLTVRATQDLSRFDLDLLLPASHVSVDGRTARHHRHGNHELVVTPRQPISAGSTFTVEVRYAGQPAGAREDGEANWLADQREAVAMNEPHMATWWFPADDHPSDKASYDVHITAPRGDQVVSNGLPVGRRVHGSWATTHWWAVEPMASYLAFFAVGRFEVRQGVEATASGPRQWYVAVSRELPARQRRAAVAVLQQTPSIVDWLESQLGPYPFSATGGLVTGLDPGFALENQTRPTYPRGGANQTTLVHELAHQWFGDSVSVAQWRDIVLNEGFATFMELRWNETHGGQSAADWLRQMYRSRDLGPLFWKLPIDDPGAGQLFDGPVYDRGAMALQALRNRIGEDAFWTLLRSWASGHAYGNGSVPQFEALAAQVSGQDLIGFFDAWLHEPTQPANTAENGLL